MNKQIETKKVLVSNGQVLLAELAKWKKSGGEWKILENYFTHEYGGVSTYGIIISNGQQQVNCYFSDNYHENPDNIGFLSPNEKQKLKELFPKTPFFGYGFKKRQSGYVYTSKVLDKNGIRTDRMGTGTTRITRYLNAWNIFDVEKILTDYYLTNQTEIEKYFQNNLRNRKRVGLLDFSAPWIEVASDEEKFYIWVGERDVTRGFYHGGGELTITLRKDDLLNKYDEKGDKYFDYSGFERTQRLRRSIDTFWRVLTRFDYQEDRKGANSSTIKRYKNYQVGFASEFGSNLPDSENYIPKSPQPINGKNNSLNDTIKTQLLQYFSKNKIKKITLDNDQLIIEYDGKITQKAGKDNELEKYHQLIKNLPNQSLSLSELQSPSLSQSNPNNHLFTLSLILISGVVVMATAVYFLRQKKQRK